MKLEIKKLESSAVTPTRGSAQAAGLDLYSLETTSISPLQRKLIKTGISIAIPEGFYGRIAPRSGLALKHGIDVFAGVIDADYRGELMVLLFNSDSEAAFTINTGDRIAQLIVEPYAACVAVEVEDLSDSSRGGDGFGSTGK